jgi:hypothetical protein
MVRRRDAYTDSRFRKRNPHKCCATITTDGSLIPVPQRLRLPLCYYRVPQPGDAELYVEAGVKAHYNRNDEQQIVGTFVWSVCGRWRS